MLWNLVLEKTLESPLDCKEIQLVHPKGDQSWLFIGSTDVEAETPIFWPTWCEELTHLKRRWYWERLQAGGEGDDRGWDGWMASPTWWTWVWVDCGSWWWTGRPGMLRFMGSQRVGHDWATELNWTFLPLSFPASHAVESLNPAGSITGPLDSIPISKVQSYKHFPLTAPLTHSGAWLTGLLKRLLFVIPICPLPQDVRPRLNLFCN